MKRIIILVLCILLCLSFSSAFVLATDMDDDELPSIPIDPDLPVPTRKVRILAPESWGNVYLYDQIRGSFGPFPGTMVSKNGMTCFADVPFHVTNLTIVASDGSQQTEPPVLEDRDLEIVITVGEDAVSQVFYGIIGDVTGDGKLNIGDAAKIYSHMRGSNPFVNPEMLGFADATGDGRVNMGDVAKLYAYVRATVPK